MSDPRVSLAPGTPDGARGDSFVPQSVGSKSENGVLDLSDEAAGNEVTVGVAWLWCITASLAWWALVVWAVERVV